MSLPLSNILSRYSDSKKNMWKKWRKNRAAADLHSNHCLESAPLLSRSEYLKFGAKRKQ
jgi:hypothetical protein